MESLYIFLAGWISTLSGVIVGGFLVYRTKRDPYDPLFTGPSSKGDSFNVDDDFSQGEFTAEKTPEATAGANSDFVKQFSERLSKI